MKNSMWGVWGEFTNGKSCWLWLIPPTKKTKITEFWGGTSFFKTKTDAQKLYDRWSGDSQLKELKIAKVCLPEG